MLRKASQKIKRLSVQSQSRYSELENNLKVVKVKYEKDKNEKVDELIHEIEELEKEMKNWEIEISPVLARRRFNSFKFIESSILRKRLATYMNRIPKSGNLLKFNFK